MSYSQNLEEQYILDFFKGYTGNLLSVGENDGKTLSNVLRLIELGWSALLVEPSPIAFEMLTARHKDNEKVKCINAAIGETEKTGILHESGAHLGIADVALLSSLNRWEMERWSDVDFKDVEVKIITYKSIEDNYDFISIDAEGNDLIILKQIDLTYTKLLCIEWNSIEQTKKEILNYTLKFGMNKIIYQSPENLLICR